MGKSDFGRPECIILVDLEKMSEFGRPFSVCYIFSPNNSNMKKKAASRERGQDTLSRAEARPLGILSQNNHSKKFLHLIPGERSTKLRHFFEVYQNNTFRSTKIIHSH